MATYRTPRVDPSADVAAGSHQLGVSVADIGNRKDASSILSDHCPLGEGVIGDRGEKFALSLSVQVSFTQPPHGAHILRAGDAARTHSNDALRWRLA